MRVIPEPSPLLPPPADARQADGSILAGGFVRYGLAMLYAFALSYAYDVLSVWWAYFGFTYKLQNEEWRYGACFIAAVPATLLSARPRSFAEAAAWFLYILVFIPCLIVPVMQFSAGEARLFRVFIATFLSCVLFLLLVRGEVRQIKVPSISPRLFWSGLWIVWLAMLILVVVSFGASFQFVGADDVYTQRFLGADVAANPVVRYSIAILASAIDPFLIAFGLYSRRYWITGAGAAGQVVLFGTLAARSVLLSPFIVVAVYFLADKRGTMRGNLMLVGLLAVFIATIPLLAQYNPIGGGLNEIVSLLYLRTLLIAGATFGVYDQFFSIFPLTYFSNSNLISLFIQYPYGDLSVGQTVQQFLIPSNAADLGELNANFLATDGIAALGVVGIPIAGAATALALRILSWFVPRERMMLMVSGGTGFMISLANSSLLTSLVTGGGILLTILVSLAPSDDD